jgi:hypothetical protein
MHTVKKYTNIEKEFPAMPKVLQEAIQNDVLEIRRLDINCDKFQHACDVFKELTQASYVIFSPYIKRSEHRYETFVFTDKHGTMVGHINGAEMELYGLLKPCINLSLTPEYANTHLNLKEHEHFA